ncbi:bifunctional serine/threonine-protein kinase/ABC transporter substrate-binding protein [Streptomyces sp. NPDC097619]|uniref:bifunctional serine/threonine-protein kinase/ABC transporter substrate-binding protein n=1 Tax=Streptomyces sp. NPDC097619 TaxID=3157228 RepID=UPI00332CE1B6
MRPLTRTDPSHVGGHRLLGRLGSGGMGTVYLGRSPSGTLTALKVIRAEHAADPAFRARFRREAEVLSGLRGPWLVPATAADPEAREPWLATPFVPAPSLAEAVALHGPLPARTVRILGRRLAEALAEIHITGLVHRDLKPGNILLALDGPRLIDFGIARPEGATALTATGAVVGTPGYLAPEQARSDGDGTTPAADVFSLGCVLAFAATGHGPFGGGHPAAVVFRTVHEEPDLEDVSAALLATVTACLAKDPGLRPTAAELTDRLGPGDREGPDGPGGDPESPGGGPEGREPDWLPPALPRIIAERSARALELPAPDPTLLDPTAADPPTGRPRLTRRGLLTAGAVLAATAPAAWYASTLGSDGTTPGTGTGSPRNRPVHTLALHADLTGPGRATGLAQERGARLAVDAHNARADAPFLLRLRPADDRGDLAAAGAIARTLIADPTVLAVLGPTRPDSFPTAARAYGKARMPLVTVSVPLADYDFASMPTSCSTRVADGMLSLPVLHYLSVVRRVTRTATVYDPTAADIARGLADSLLETSPSGGTTTEHRLGTGAGAPAAAVTALRAAGAQGVVYCGTDPVRAARFARALADSPFSGPRVTLAPAMEPAFLTEAGSAAEGWAFSAPFADPAAVPAAAPFVAAHREAYGTAPARWALEAYDAVGLVAAAITAVAAGSDGTTARSPLAVRVVRTAYRGLAKPLDFGDVNHMVTSADATFLYRAESGRYVCLGPVPRANPR